MIGKYSHVNDYTLLDVPATEWVAVKKHLTFYGNSDVLLLYLSSYGETIGVTADFTAAVRDGSWYFLTGPRYSGGCATVLLLQYGHP